MVRGQIVLAVQGGVGVELEAQVAAVEVDRDVEVLDRPGGQVVHLGLRAAEAQVVVEGLDVDHRPEQRAVHAHSPQVPAQLLTAVVLVPAQVANGFGGLRDQFVAGGSRGDAQAQRQDVDDHARHPQGDRAEPAHHRQAEQHVPRAGHAVHVGANRGDKRVGPDRAAEAGGNRQGVGGLGACRGGQPQEVVGAHPDAAGERRRLGLVGQQVPPVLRVLARLLGLPVAPLLGDQRVQRLERRRPGVLAHDQCAVDLGDPADDDREAVAVDGHVVDPLVPEPVVLTDLQ